MTTVTATLPPLADPEQRRRRAALIRAIGRRRPGTRLHFVCGACESSWSGPEHCFLCGRPATTEYTHRNSALQLLLQHIRPAPSGPAVGLRPRRTR
jgi:hypothetical protein